MNQRAGGESRPPFQQWGSPVTEVIFTNAARDLIKLIRQDQGEVALYQNSGCVCGDAPQCFSALTFRPAPSDYVLDTGDATLLLWRSSKLDRSGSPARLIINAKPGRRGGFALENLFESMFVVVDEQS